MALEHRLEVKMLQKLVLTPQLQQAIKLLQMPQLELSQTLNNELVENPFLEEVTEDSERPDEPEAMEAEAEQVISSESEEFKASEDAEAPIEDMLGFSVDEYFDSRSYDGRDLGYFGPDSNAASSLEQYVSESTTLYDHLVWQLRFSDASAKVRDAAEAVIGNIDENGYLTASAEDIAINAECSPTEADQAIALVQTFDPPGIGARDLIECLVIQLGQLDLKGSLVERLVRNNLPDIERRRYAQLAAEHNVSLDEIKGALKVIEGLEPKPGRSFSAIGDTVYIKPDVYVLRDSDDFRIVLNDDSVPNIRINGYYRRILSQRNTLDKEEREYLTERLRSAVWLLKSLDHRNKTLYRVTESILRFQREFFEADPAKLRPLTLRDVAQELQMHESTISRATSNKYLSCSHGLYGFRFFFSSGIQTADGEVSSTSVKDMIRKMIEQEDQRKPLSDQKIAGMLERANIKVARRTIAKYRDELNIAPVSQRRRSE